jgi:hypothetical protein
MAGAKSMPSYEAMIAQAEAAVAALRDSYRETLSSDIASLEETFARVEGGSAVAEVLKEIHSVAHNIKGQGGSFGYDLVTSIGASLCDYLRSGERTSKRELDIVNAHIKLLRLVSDNDLSGNGGDTGARIVEKLKTLTA